MLPVANHPGPIIESLEDRRLLSADLSAAFPGRLPAALPVDGTSVINVRLTNHGNSIAQGPVQVELFASTDGTLDDGDLSLITKSLNVSLRPHAAQNVRLSFTTPTTLADGDYDLLAEVVGSPAVVGTPVVAASPAPVEIQTPFSDLSLQFATLPSQPIELDGASAGKRIATVFVTNSGNVPVRGRVDVSLYLSTDDVLDGSDPLLATASNRPIALKPGAHSITGFRIAIPPGTAVGGYFLIAEMTPVGTLVDSNPADNVAVSPRRVAVVTTLPQTHGNNHNSYSSGASVAGGDDVVTTVDCPPDDSSQAADDSSDDSQPVAADPSSDSSDDPSDSTDDSSDSSDDSSDGSSSSPDTSSDDSSDSSDDGSADDGGDF
jgi:hypothetical protein